ncbi:MAG: alpha-galactosidase [Henriciella sp.]
MTQKALVKSARVNWLAISLSAITLAACQTPISVADKTAQPVSAEAIIPQPETAAVIQLAGSQLEIADNMHARLSLQDVDTPGFAPAYSIVSGDGEKLDTFGVEAVETRSVETLVGPGSETLIKANSADGIAVALSVQVPEGFPGSALITISYTNSTDQEFGIESWQNNAFTLPMDEASAWAFMGSSHVDRRDWIMPISDGHYEANFMGMNSSDYGSGTPVADIWSRHGGIAVGHLETHPRLVSLPVSAADGIANVAISEQAFEVLAPGETFTTPITFVTTHKGDFFNPLSTYREMMAQQGFKAPEMPATAYESIWCAWGYERDFDLNDVLDTLPKAKELGLEWAVLDDGWQTSEGDWYLSPEKFPNGDADMTAFVDEIKDAGMKPKLWIAPLAVDPGTDLMHQNTDMLLLNEWGQPQLVTWWNSFFLCPAYEPTVENGKALIRKIVGEWGYRGLKLDGQHLNGVAPCYNPAHNHERPEESIEGLQDYWRELYETAMEIDPEAVIELCPCGTSYAFHNMPYFNQAVSSDPLSSWQVRLKGKAIKALMGPTAAYAGDHVELSDNGDDFASTVGIGAVVSTKFTWPTDAGLDNDTLLTPEREAEWSKWIGLYNEKALADGVYRGDLYDLGFDLPETHAVEKNGQLHYSFYAESYEGQVEFRGLAPGRYVIFDYVNGNRLGEISAAEPTLNVSFEHALLVEARHVGAD